MEPMCKQIDQRRCGWKCTKTASNVLALLSEAFAPENDLGDRAIPKQLTKADLSRQAMRLSRDPGVVSYRTAGRLLWLCCQLTQPLAPRDQGFEGTARISSSINVGTCLLAYAVIVNCSARN
ncbi:hypothetical protein LIA77_10264 [Sarocladium implicatum]|nr:hypothetical protein LIA77_10264 [Sarocladium implicatum]